MNVHFILEKYGYKNEKGVYEWITECKLDLNNLEKYIEDMVDEMIKCK